MMIEVLALAGAVTQIAGSISTAIKAGRDVSDLLPHFGKLAKLDADISGAIAEISSKSDLQTYLTNSANANSWKDLNSDGEEVTFDAAAHATKVWNDLDTLNG